jgi:glycosyltransferase involved in cell wall biosynthesis
MPESIPTFSVVIPLPQGHPVVEAMHSVLKQTYLEFELVVVDNGLADGGAGLVEGIRDPRIRLVSHAT